MSQPDPYLKEGLDWGELQAFWAIVWHDPPVWAFCLLIHPIQDTSVTCGDLKQGFIVTATWKVDRFKCLNSQRGRSNEINIVTFKKQTEHLLWARCVTACHCNGLLCTVKAQVLSCRQWQSWSRVPRPVPLEHVIWVSHILYVVIPSSCIACNTFVIVWPTGWRLCCRCLFGSLRERQWAPRLEGTTSLVHLHTLVSWEIQNDSPIPSGKCSLKFNLLYSSHLQSLC